MDALKAEYRIFNSGDAWGNCMGWLFAIADYMTEEGIEVPAEWQFRQSPFGANDEAPEYQALVELEPSESDLRQFGAMLWRLRRILIARGKDY